MVNVARLAPYSVSSQPAGPSVGGSSRWSALPAGNPALPCAAHVPPPSRFGQRGVLRLAEVSAPDPPAGSLRQPPTPPSRLPTARTSRPRKVAARRGKARAGKIRQESTKPIFFVAWVTFGQGYLRPEGVRKVRKGLKNAAFCIVCSLSSLKTQASASSRASKISSSWCS